MAETGDAIQNLERHLEQWLLAYGADLAIPKGKAIERETPITQQIRTPLQGATEEHSPKEEVAHTPAIEPQSTPQPAVEALAPSRVAPSETTSTDAASIEAGETPQTNHIEKVTALREVRAEIHSCTKCKLHGHRINTVFGEGSPDADVMFIGEAPGAKEDETGRPFVGAAGELLDRILAAAMGMQRKEVFIANINKCRPPGNRAPEADEVAACLPYLKLQVELVQPKVLVCLGRTAAQNLLGSSESISSMRRKRHEYCGIPVVVTWHPAYLLREPSRKRETWDDIKTVNRLLGRPEVPPPKA